MKRVLFIIFLFFSFNAKAVTYGTYTCGQILSWERENNTTQIRLTKLYLAGFIHGYNLHVTETVFDGIDDETIWYLLVNKCKSNPKLDSYDATLGMIIDEIVE